MVSKNSVIVIINARSNPDPVQKKLATLPQGYDDVK